MTYFRSFVAPLELPGSGRPLMPLQFRETPSDFNTGRGGLMSSTNVFTQQS